jgi:hypothetical protein
MSGFDITKPGGGWTKSNSKSVFQLGKNRTFAVPMELHVQTRKKLVRMFADKGINSGILLFKGGEQQCQYDSDTEVIFR